MGLYVKRYEIPVSYQPYNIIAVFVFAKKYL